MAVKYSGSNVLTYIFTLMKNKFVAKEENKGLSTNDYTTEEKNKLAGIATGATKNDTDANLKNRANHTGTQSADTIVDGTNNKVFTAAEKTKLGGLYNYTLPNASDNILGGIKVGSGLVIDENGILSATQGGTADSVEWTGVLNKPTGLVIDTSYVHTDNNYTDAEKLKLANLSVPVISTSIDSDAASDVKTTSPKAVKTYVDSKISSTYKPAGSSSFASLPTPSKDILGNVYNVSDDFNTTSIFLEGTGKSYPAGTNVVVVDSGNSTYLYDVLAGMVDLSKYAMTEDFEEFSNSEIDSLWNAVFTS